LNPYCSSLEISEALSLICLAKVQHLKRKIVGYLNPKKAESTLVDVFHPTAAIAGLPKDQAMEFIQQNEPFERGLYSRAIGYISQDRSEFCVSIRSALINKKASNFTPGQA
jgi:menaquinone-specific isochorismate synthase